MFPWLVIGGIGAFTLFLRLVFFRKNLRSQLLDRDNRRDCELFSSDEIKRVTELIGEDLGVPESKIYLEDDLRSTLGYDFDKFSAVDDFEDLFFVLQSLNITMEDAMQCKTVADLVNKMRLEHPVMNDR